jgi:hypothetical protein
MDVTPRRRRAQSTVLALLLAVESVSAVAAAARVNVAQRDGAARTAPALAASRSVDDADAQAVVPAVAQAASSAASVATVPFPAGPAGLPDGGRFALPLPAAPAIDAKPDRPAAPAAKAKVEKATKAPKPKPSASPATFKGRNHVWIPALRINRSVSWFPCDRTRDPDSYVYRWGCAGTNNVYLLGHAYSVFKPLHDAYVNHRLKVGMKAWYADAKGKVHVYAVRWWKLTLPTPDASWAWAAQSRPSMTLQTCVGANSRYRLIVRLVEVAG